MLFVFFSMAVNELFSAPTYLADHLLPHKQYHDGTFKTRLCTYRFEVLQKFLMTH